jgi:Tol biopolymer transport system component
MGDAAQDAPPAGSSPKDRLDSWKEIAAYLDRDVTTVQRWEKREGMPVHRHLHDRIGSVYASRAELDAWTRTRNLPPNPDLPAASTLSVTPTRSTRPFPAQVVPLLAALLIAAALGGFWWLQRADYFWRSPIANARLQTITDFDGLSQAAAISRDGHFVAFLSDRDGQVDLFVTQLGSGQFHNLTRGSIRGLSNPSLRSLGFSPDASLVTFWVRKQDASGGADIGIWAVPTLGGQSKPLLDGVAEYDWSPDGSRITYHTPGPGDPLFVADANQPARGRNTFTAPAGLHSHFPTWSPDGSFIYFVQGSLPDNLDIWRISAGGGNPQRITFHNSRVSHPVFLGPRTLIYLASGPDGSGPWLYTMDPEHGITHRLSSGLDRYTSLASSADGRRLVATLASPKRTLWRLPLTGSSTPSRISLTTNTGFFPRFGRDYLLFVSSNGSSQSIWKTAGDQNTELWTGDDAQILGGPAISPDGHQVAFSLAQHGQTFLYAMNSDGTNARVVADSVRLQGAPAWAPDAQSIITAAGDLDAPHLLRIPVDRGSPAVPFLRDYSIDPTWSPNGSFLIYSGADIGTTFPLKAVTPQAAPRPLPTLTLTRGARHVAFLPGGQSLLLLKGDIDHKDLWSVDLAAGTQHQLTNLPADFDVRDFDISPDGREVVLERLQDRSEIVLLDLAKP